MEAEKGTGEWTQFQNSKAICFFKLASLLFPVSLSQVLTCIFSVSSFAFPKSRIISLGKNIKDSNLRNPPHVLREPDLLVSHLLSLPPSPTQTLPSPAPSSGHLNLSIEQREGHFLLTRTLPRQAQPKSIPLRDHLFFPGIPRFRLRGGDSTHRSASCVPWKSRRNRHRREAGSSLRSRNRSVLEAESPTRNSAAARLQHHEQRSVCSS